MLREIDPDRIRGIILKLLEGVPTNATPQVIQLLQLVGGENDGLTPAGPVRRYLGAAGADGHEHPRENFNHEHQDVKVENGVQFGDLRRPT
jgi:hypothetical protein